jgi:hypothetical protein
VQCQLEQFWGGRSCRRLDAQRLKSGVRKLWARERGGQTCRGGAGGRRGEGGYTASVAGEV